MCSWADYVLCAYQVPTYSSASNLYGGEADHLESLSPIATKRMLFQVSLVHGLSVKIGRDADLPQVDSVIRVLQSCTKSWRGSRNSTP